MDRLKTLLRQTEFHMLLFFVLLFLFGWPLATLSTIQQLKPMFEYLFATWIVMEGLVTPSSVA